jgi:peptidoglycan-N-acetylglucosamine deacetylase
VPVSGRYIAMTFDDGPHPVNTPRLLNMLKQRNIKATFFMIGRSVDANPSVARRVAAEGHEIGNHSYTHTKLSSLSMAGIMSEIERTDSAIERAVGYKSRVMRPPYGALTQDQRAAVKNQTGHPTILWSVDPLDWKKPGASVVTSRILAGASNGGIILAHDLHSSTVDAMPATLDGLIAKGYRFVTVSELIAMQTSTQASIEARDSAIAGR